jgi:hypothetical protein
MFIYIPVKVANMWLYVYVFAALIVIVTMLIIFAPNERGRGHRDPKGQGFAEAKTTLAFAIDDELRAVEYEHRFSASRAGMLHDRSGYKVEKKKKL